MSAIERDREDDSDLYPRGPMPTEKPTEDLTRCEVGAGNGTTENCGGRIVHDPQPECWPFYICSKHLIANRDEWMDKYHLGLDAEKQTMAVYNAEIAGRDAIIASLNESLKAADETCKDALRELDFIWVFSVNDYPEQKQCFENALKSLRTYLASRQKEDKDK